MKNCSLLKGSNSRLEQADEMTHGLEDKATKILQFEEQIEKRMK